MPRDELIVLAGEQADQLAAQDRQITALATQVADLMEANEQLTAKLARLEHAAVPEQRQFLSAAVDG